MTERRDIPPEIERLSSRATMRRPALQPLLKKYRDFRRGNRRLVKNLNNLSRVFTRMMTVNLRSNEPFRVENVVHRCMKKRRLEQVSEEISQQLQRDFRSVKDFITAYENLTGEDVSGYRAVEEKIRAAFLERLWYLMRVIIYNLCDDTTFMTQLRGTLKHVTEIKPDVSQGLLTPGADLTGHITSFNEIARVLHQRGDDSFFQQVRRLHGTRVFSLGRQNRLELLDLDGTETDLVPGETLDPEKVKNPALKALIIPYSIGHHGAGQEILNIAVVDGILDTQFTLGLHKANLRAFIDPGTRSDRNFISLSYYEPPHPVHSPAVGKRLRYFSGILEALDYGIHTDTITYLSAEFRMGSASTASTLTETMRAIISLKDLDEVPGLTDDPSRIVALFRKGVTNLLGFFNTLRNFQYFISGQMDERSFRLLFRPENLNPVDVQVLFEEEFPRRVRLQAKRGKLNIPEMMRLLRSFREEAEARLAEAKRAKLPEVPDHKPPP